MQEEKEKVNPHRPPLVYANDPLSFGTALFRLLLRMATIVSRLASHHSGTLKCFSEVN